MNFLVEKKEMPGHVFRRKLGFSLVEALVVVSITVILTTILVVNSRANEKQIIFFREQSVLVSAVLRAKAFSIETFQPELEPGLPAPTGADQVCGWGIYFDKDAAQAVIYNDLAPGGGVSGCTSANHMYDSGAGSNEKFETITLDPAVVIHCIGVNPGPDQDCNSNLSQLHITFTPPDPTVFFKPIDDAEAVIELRLADPGQSRATILRISKAGQVSVD